MIPKDLWVIDLGGDNWSRVIALFNEVGRKATAGERRGPLLVIYRGLKLLKAIDLATASPVEVEFMGTSRLDALSRDTGYPVVVALEETALARITGHLQREVDFRDDYLKQATAYIRALSMEWRKTVFVWPQRPRRIPVVPYRVFDLLCHLAIPRDSLILCTITEGGRAWCSLVVGYRDGQFWLLSSLDALGDEHMDLRGDALKAAAEALSDHFGDTTRALAVERSVLQAAATTRFPLGALLWAVNTSELRTVRIPWRWKAIALVAGLFVRGRK